ncbi:hypothetical protein [Patulibacter sp. SYSU D01012]|uniref:hypothetical protein n=1 Tax=Patulibacter sp. SYSU D01012 TaxID=2817381 RepID=UPI001B3172B5|nr:hypothetical protein [Patulibacter sp. SYSU D01012]
MMPASYYAHAARVFRAGLADADVVDPLARFALAELARSMDALVSTYGSGASGPARPLAALKDPA